MATRRHNLEDENAMADEISKFDEVEELHIKIVDLLLEGWLRRLESAPLRFIQSYKKTQKSD